MERSSAITSTSLLPESRAFSMTPLMAILDGTTSLMKDGRSEYPRALSIVASSTEVGPI
jgi:hypothetical protein